MNRKRLLEQLIELVTADLERARCAAKASSESATHEENRAEGIKDMRSTEASYLARGQTMRVEELEEILNRLHFIPLQPFDETTPISAGALVCLETEEAQIRWYWLVPGAAGYELHHERTVLTTVTPKSPLGRAMTERLQGDEIVLTIGGRVQRLEIIEVA